MNNKIGQFGVIILVTCLLMSGCWKKPYAHKVINPGDAEYAQVESMIESLRKSTPQDIAAKQDVSDMPKERMEMLLYCLESISKADSVRLTDVDSFGPQIYRASMELESAKKGKSTLTMLLLKTDDEKLLWLGPN